MGIFDRILRRNAPQPSLTPAASEFLQSLEKQLSGSSLSPKQGDAARLVKAIVQRQSMSAPTVGVPDLGFKGARQQLFQRFNLIDLYGIAHNNSTVKTAVLTLRHEVFRRGLQWDPAFAFRCSVCSVDFSKDEQAEYDGACPTCNAKLQSPNPLQRVAFERLMPHVNLYGQSLLSLLKTLEDDLNIADDAFLLASSEYQLTKDDHNQVSIKRFVRQLFRLDPIFVEFDTDDNNRPGLAHHICLAHRENLLEVPRDAGWEHDWKGVCPIDNFPTLPVVYRYVPTRGTYGAQKGGVNTAKDAYYFVKGEVIHASKYSPSELYGYSPLLGLYEKALSLIGMDRYLYDYFFERKMPQGVITTVTDNPEQLEIDKELVLAKTLEDPHYLPWLAVSSNSGQGRTEFVRFAYSLDELQFLPVQESLAKAVAGLYGIPDLFMGFDTNSGGIGNQSQQITRMGRGAAASQTVHNTDILGPLLEIMGVTDWVLTLSSAEDYTETEEWDIKERKAQWATSMHAMGFGVKYDQEGDEFTITGEVPSMQEQQEAQQQQDPYAQFGGGAPGGF